jgi:outer membrane protein assembly factor BamB
MRAVSPIALVFAMMALGACDTISDIMGPPAAPPLKGERVRVLAADTRLEADQRLAALTVTLPEPTVNDAWPQPGGSPGNAPGHVAGANLKVLWRTDVGAGSGLSGRIVSPPVVAAGKVFVMDAVNQVSAVDEEMGKILWQFDTTAEGARSDGTGGGVAYDNGRVYVTTGDAQVIALDANDGKVIWRSTVTAPVRSGPTVGGGRVFTISIDNQVHALDAATGKKQWSHSGITETAGLYGSSTPAFDGNVVIAPFSSGEIFALRADNGRVLWGDSLAGIVKSDAVSSLADIRGYPVVDRGQVFAASHGGRMVGIDLRTGGRIWDQDVGSLYTPWLAGEFIFVTTVNSQVVCLTRREGRVRWVTQLDQYDNPDRKRGRIVWTGPVLIGDRLLVSNSRGEAVVISPTDGKVTQQIDLPGGVEVPAAVASGTVFLLTDDGDLVALR